MDANKARGVQLVAERDPQSRRPTRGRGGSAAAAGRRRSPPSSRPSCERGDTIYKELCFSCHGDDGRGAPQPGARRHGRWRRRSRARRACTGIATTSIKTLLHGLTGPIDGKLYAAGVMVPMGTNRDEWIADDRLVRAQQLRQPRLVRDAGGRGARARRNRRSQDDVDARPSWKASLPVLLAAQPDVEGDARAHNAADGVRRVHVPGLVDRCAAAAGDVVPGGAAGAVCADRNAVRLDRRRRARRRARCSRGAAAGAAGRGTGSRRRGRATACRRPPCPAGRAAGPAPALPIRQAPAIRAATR